MATVTSLTMQETSCLNDSMIFALLDQSWYSQSILNRSLALSVPFAKPETVLRPSSQADNNASGAAFSTTSEECSISKSVDDDHHHVRYGQKNRDNNLSERKRCYSVDEDELRSVFHRFDENADGLISGEELGRYMRCCYGKDISDEEAKSMVSCVDHNNDDAVDFEEFLSLYQKSRRDSGDDAIGDDIGEDEEDNDDLLKTFRLFDRNHDGFISAHELQAVLLNLGMAEGKCLRNCEKMIRNVDRDGDGQCDFIEFREMMSAEPSS